jgi:hypothetical protein
MTIVYRQRGNTVEKILIPGRRGIRSRGGDHFNHNSERVLKGYYDLECSGEFRSNYPKSILKKVHETAMARAEAGMDSRLNRKGNEHYE